jgi:hypothetical protein
VLKKISSQSPAHPPAHQKLLLAILPDCFFGPRDGVTTQEPNMKTVFDILKKDRKGTFLWLEAVQDMEVAQARLRQLSEQSTDEFIVFRNVDLKVVATSRKE